MVQEIITYRGASSKPLTALQELFVEAFFECDGKISCVAKKLDRSVEHASQINKVSKVQRAIAMRTRVLAKNVGKMPDFAVSKPERLELLWKIANQGIELIYDREGNQVMQSPATSVSAVRTINEMLPGSLATKELDINVKIEDKRTELEIRESIQALTAEYTVLASLEGVTEKDVSKTRALPDIEDVELRAKS